MKTLPNQTIALKKAFGLYVHTCGGVKSCTDENELWRELVHNRHDDLVECINILSVAHPATWPRDIDVPM